MSSQFQQANYKVSGGGKFKKIIFILFSLILLVAAVFGGYWYGKKQADQQNNKAISKLNQQIEGLKQAKQKVEEKMAGLQASQESEKNTLVVKEWNVQATIPDSLKNLSYHIEKNTIYFSSDNQKELTCKEINADKAWGITREASGKLKNSDGTNMSDEEARKNPAYKHIANYYYHAVYPIHECKNQEDAINNLNLLYKQLFESLK